MPRIAVEERRQLLVAAALRVVSERGLEAATTRAIVSEAGMSLASFHYAFGSRDELIDRLIDEVLVVEEAAILPAATAGGSLEDLIAAGLNGYLGHLRADPAREQVMLEFALHALRTGSPLAARQYAQYTRIALRSLQLAARATGRRWATPPETVAALLVALTDGLTLTWLVSRDDATAEAVVAAAARAVAALAHPDPDEPAKDEDHD